MSKSKPQFRSLSLPDELGILDNLDTTFKSTKIYLLRVTTLGMRLEPETLVEPFCKTYIIEKADWSNWDFAEIVLIDETIYGFIACIHEAWNNRLVIQHLYIDPKLRGQRLGSQFISRAEAFATSMNARCLWVETQNTNLPAISAYQSWGFAICGFDTSLYDDPASIEQAVFLTKFLKPNAIS